MVMMQTVISIVGVCILFFYSVTKLFDFYGVGSEWYGVYVAFYGFILISLGILPRQIPDLVPVTSTGIFAAVSQATSTSTSE